MTTAPRPLVSVRALQLLDAHNPLTIVWGPAGYGKAVLVESWLAGRPDLTSAWISGPSVNAPADTYWAGVDEQLTALGIDATLVLERPDLTDDEHLWERLQGICSARPDLRVVVTACDAGFFWADAGMPRSDAAIVGPDDLELTVDDVTAAVAEHGLTVSERTVRDGHHRTGGHPSLVGLFIDVVRVFGRELDFERARASALFEDGIDRYVLSALDAGGMTPQLREDAIALSLAARVSGGSANALGIKNIQGSLTALERRGLLVRRPELSGLRWRFPAAVRTSLRRIGESEDDRRSRVGAADLIRWFMDNGEPVDALRHATDLQEWDLVVELVLGYWVWIGVAATDVLVQALMVLPEEAVRSNAALYYGRELAVRMASERPHEPPRLVEGDRPRQLIPMLTVDRDLEAIAVQDSVDNAVLCGTLRSVTYRWRGEFSEAVRHNTSLAEMSRELFAEMSDGAAESSLLPLLCLHLGQSSQFHGDDTDAERFFRMAVDGDGRRKDSFVGLQAAGHLALLYALRGETAEAQRWIDRESAYGHTPGWVGSVATIPATVARGLVALDTLDVTGAAAVIDNLPDPEDSVEYWMFVEYARCQLDLVRGESQIGLDRLGRATIRFSRWMPSDSLAAPLLRAVSMDLSAAAGDTADVVARARLLDRDQMHPSVVLSAARSELLSGSATSALGLCGTLTDPLTISTRVRLEALLIAAMCHLDVGSDDSARIAWNRAVALSQSSRLLGPFATVPAATRQRFAALGVLGPAPSLFNSLREIYPQPVPEVTLTNRERDVLAGLVRGESVENIAETLFVSPNTVKTQLKGLYRKLGVHTRNEAIDASRRRGVHPALHARHH